MASNTISFLGRRFFIGAHATEQQAAAAREELNAFRSTLIDEALERFEEFRNELIKPARKPSPAPLTYREAARGVAEPRHAPPEVVPEPPPAAPLPKSRPRGHGPYAPLPKAVPEPTPAAPAAPLPKSRPRGHGPYAPLPKVAPTAPEVAPTAPEVEQYLDDEKVRASVPVGERDEMNSEATVNGTVYDLEEFESHMNLDFDNVYIYWKRPDSYKYEFKTTI